MFTKQKIILGVTLLYLVSNTAFPAPKISVEKDKQAAFNNIHNLNSDYNFKEENVVIFPNGNRRYKLIEYYKGVRVFDTALLVSKPNIRPTTAKDLIGGDYIIKIEDEVVEVIPTISEAQAIEIALNKAPTLSFKPDASNAKAELIIKRDKSGYAALVYLVDYFNDDIFPTRPFIVVDAHTGKILQTWEGLTTKNATGPGGNSKTGKYFYGTDYGPLIVDQAADGSCVMNSGNVTTWDMRNGTKAAVLHKFTCPVNTYKEVNGSYSPINDAHFFGETVYNMYNSWFKVSPLKKSKIKLRVHYGKDFSNAFWDGSNKQMNFGDGDRKNYPYVAPDVVGHEISHGFTEENSNLVYEEQSGALNESFSDMAGQAIKYFLNKDKPEAERTNWVFGEAVLKEPGAVKRYIDNPSKDGRTPINVKDNKYYTEMPVHLGSGIFNRAFYLLSTKPGWNIKKAFEVFVWANQLRWTQNTTFDEAACGVKILAAEGGLKAADLTDISQAFEAVGVDASCTTGIAAPDSPPPPPPPPPPKPCPCPCPTPIPAPCPDPHPIPYPSPCPYPSPYPEPYPYPYPYPSHEPYPEPYPFPCHDFPW